MPQVTISGKPYDYDQTSTGIYLTALYNAAVEHGITETAQDIERLYWQLPENQKKWMRDIGFKPVEQKQTKAAQKMRVLVACEESQAVCIAFRERGHEAFSCDIQPCSGGHPEWHIISDVFKIIEGGFFNTENGDLHEVWEWDMMLAFPPCTHLSAAGAPSWKQKQADGRQKSAIEFVIKLWSAPIQMICIENPTGILNTSWRKPSQIIHPYYFGDPFKKRTCLWLRGLSVLEYHSQRNLFGDKTLVQPEYHYTSNSYRGGKRKDGTRRKSSLPVFKAWDSAKERSKTFPGIAKAMAEQWG